MTFRHRALNCPAGIVFMTTPNDYGHYHQPGAQLKADG
jgi:hypothetical protein